LFDLTGRRLGNVGVPRCRIGPEPQLGAYGECWKSKGDALAESTFGEIIGDFPDVDEEDIRQALAYAAALAEDERHPLRA
jgi:hypothetical protein